MHPVQIGKCQRIFVRNCAIPGR